MAEALARRHLADLHALAAERGVEAYRLLPREELIARLEELGGAGDEPAEEERAAPRRGRRGRERLEEAADQGGEAVTGVLEVSRQRHGFLRPESGGDDVYVSASQIRRCELRPGDVVTGPVRGARRGERHRALVHVDLVNGSPPAGEGRPSFDSLTPVIPSRRLPLDRDGVDPLVRAVDLLVPLAFGQRVLISAAPVSGRTTLLRGIARALQDAGAGEGLTALLIDERPEEAAAWRQALPDGEVAAAPADMAPAEQVRTAELALERARRAAEQGADAVLVVDSLSRLAVAAGGITEVKRLFGSGRDLAEEGAGSLTVIATVVAGAEDDGAAERAVATTENALVSLSAQLAGEGISPPLDVSRCRVSNEEELRSPEELAAARRLRSLLGDLDPAEAAKLLRERVEASATNAQLLAAL